MTTERSKIQKSNWRVYLITRLEDMKDRIDALLSIVPPADCVASDALLHLAKELSTVKQRLEEE